MLVVELTVDKDLAFCDITSQIGNRVSDICDNVNFSATEDKQLPTVVGHGQDGDLGDGTISTLDSTSSLVEGSQIGVEITRVTSSTWHLLSCSRDFSQSIGITDVSGVLKCVNSPGHVGHDNKHVLLELVGKVLCSSQSQTRSNNTLNPVASKRQDSPKHSRLLTLGQRPN